MCDKKIIFSKSFDNCVCFWWPISTVLENYLGVLKVKSVQPCIFHKESQKSENKKL